MTSTSPISREIALRIALAARVLPECSTESILKIIDETIGLPPTPAKLSSLAMKKFKPVLCKKFPSVSDDTVKEVLDILKGDNGIIDDFDLPEIQEYADGDMDDSVRIAVASNKAEDMDGHFSSCKRFLVYQINSEEARLIDIRKTEGPEAKDDKNVFRAGLIDDCHILFVVSIGGPAAAKVVKAGIHPIKMPNAQPARECLASIQSVMSGTPPPWLAKIMGHDSESRVRFELSDSV